MIADRGPQRIARLTPLAEVLDDLQTSVEAVAPVETGVFAAIGLTLAADVAVTSDRPPAVLAIRDGYAVRAEATADASGYTPALLDPAPERVDLGEPLPMEADAVAPLDAVAWSGGRAEALAPVAPGDGVLLAGGDAPAGMVLRLAGTRLRRIDAAALLAVGIERVAVRRPCLRVVRASQGATIEAAAGFIRAAIEAEGGCAMVDEPASLAASLGSDGCDAIVAIGGTGSGSNDRSVVGLAKAGRVAFHGIAISPGETTALGFVGPRPVLLLTGRLDAAVAGWLLVGQPLLARLAFRLIEEQPFTAELSRKVASPLGLAEVLPVCRRLGTVEPLGASYLAPQALTRSNGWILVPADSEGFPPGTPIPVRSWP
ncbi:MAG: molybdopterin-binding protein [Hyphomicrobiaceae bacterium]